jgi:thioredoxin reductase (NADPH)
VLESPLQEGRHPGSHREEMIDCAVIGSRDDEEVGARGRGRVQRQGVGERHDRIRIAMDQQHGDAHARDDDQRGEVGESLTDGSLDLPQHEAHGDGGDAVAPHRAAHVLGGIRHRRDAHDSGDVRVCGGDQQARSGAHRVAHEDDAVRVDTRIGAQPGESVLGVGGEVRHGGEVVIVAAPVATRVEQEDVQAGGQERRGDGQHEARRAGPTMDDQRRRPGAPSRSRRDEPGAQPLPARAGDAHVLRLQADFSRGRACRDVGGAEGAGQEARGGKPERGPAHQEQPGGQRRRTEQAPNVPWVEVRRPWSVPGGTSSVSHDATTIGPSSLRVLGIDMSDRLYDVAIVGAGPAGLTAALYAGRNQMHAVLIEAKVPGGQLLNTDLIEDYPGHTSIRGADLAQVLTEQAEHFGTELLIAEARRIRAVPGGLQVVETDSGEITTKAVIITAGGNPRKLGVPGEAESAGRGVSYCAVCDGPFFGGQHVAVVGGGDAAIEEALFLTRHASRVTVIHRRDEFRAQSLLLEEARANEKMGFILSTAVDAIEGEERVRHLRLRHVTTGDTSLMDVHGVFIFIGFVPNSGLVDVHVDHDAAGYLLTDPQAMLTSIPGVFAAGDVRSQLTRQITTAVGDATTATIAAMKWIEHEARRLDAAA